MFTLESGEGAMRFTLSVWFKPAAAQLLFGKESGVACPSLAEAGGCTDMSEESLVSTAQLSLNNGELLVKRFGEVYRDLGLKYI